MRENCIMEKSQSQSCVRSEIILIPCHIDEIKGRAQFSGLKEQDEVWIKWTRRIQVKRNTGECWYRSPSERVCSYAIGNLPCAPE